MIDRFGARGDLREVPVPEPGPDDVVVRVTAAGVNPVDWKIRAGSAGEKSFPLVLGNDFAGIVERTGAGVNQYVAGDRVFGTARRHGGFAQYTLVTTSAEHLAFAPLPEAVPDEIAAALPIPALTALAALRMLETGSGTSLVVVGASGSLGAAAVQLAKHEGTRVIAVVQAGQEEAALAFGADDAIVSGDDASAKILALTGLMSGVDAILDGVATAQEKLAAWAEVLVPGGKIVSTNHALDEDWFAQRGFVGKNITLFETPQSSREGLEELLAAYQAGYLRVDVSERGSLDEAADFLDRGEGHDLHGKAVVLVH